MTLIITDPPAVELSRKHKPRLDPRIIRVGDDMRIINPLIFVRCGYPLCVEDVKKEISPEIVLAAMRQVGMMIKEGTVSPDDLSWRYRLAYDKILHGLAFGVVAARKFGGNERKIFTQADETLRGVVVRVTGTRRVVTGSRVPGETGDWYTEPEPPYLDDQKHHVILSFRVPNRATLCNDLDREIELMHVEKVRYDLEE